MTKITKEVLFTELSIKLAIIDAKLDKLIELAMTEPEITIKSLKEILPEDIEQARELFKDLESTTDYDLTKPYGFTQGSVTHETIK